MANLFTRKSLLIVLIILIAVGLGLFINKGSNKNGKVTYPEYMNFDGNYVFSVPKDNSIEEHAIEGVVFVFKGALGAKTADDVINAGGISAESIKDLTDHSGKGFKKYVNETFVPLLKKNLNTDNVKVKFMKQNGQDAALITIDNGNKPYRYIKGGQHPTVIVTKQQNDQAKTIEQTLTDIEKSDLNKQVNGLKNTIKTTAEQVANQDAHSIYSSANNDFKSKTSEDQLKGVLKSAEAYTKGNVTISGFSYTPTDFAARMKFVKIDKNDQTPVFGDMSYKKAGDAWQLASLTLPTPK